MVNSNVFLEICCKNKASLQQVNFHYSGAFYSIFFPLASNGVARRLEFEKVKQGGVIPFKKNRQTLYVRA